MLRPLLLALMLALGSSAALQPQLCEAQEIDPAAEEAFFVGVALLEAGAADAAIAKFDQALRIDKQLRRVHYYRAQAWSRLGDMKQARADLDAYGLFDLADAERKQLALLRTEIEERAGTIGTSISPGRVARAADSEDGPISGPDGFSILRSAEEELARGDCIKAADTAQSALTADNTLTRAFLVKGLALECQGEAERALTVIGMYEELRAGQPKDPVASAARARLEPGSGGAAGPSPPATTAAADAWSVLGDDARIEGVLGQKWGLPMAQAVGVRTRRQYVAVAGRVDVGRPRMSVGGSTARVERAWTGTSGLQWTRLRVFERSGIETVGWFVRSFAELYREIESQAGPPDEVRGFEGTPEAPEGAMWALKGVRRIEVIWVDGDGDRVTLRLGRCTVTNDVSEVHPNNAPCLELTAHSGSWTAAEGRARFTAAAQRIEEPGRLRLDVSGGVGFGFAPSIWGLDYRNNTVGALGVEAGLDMNVRVALGPAVFGIGYALSVAGYTSFSAGVGPRADNRIMAYIGVRDRLRQRSSVDIMLGFGLAPDVRGTAGALSLRMIAQTRTNNIGRVFMSFEPYIAAGTDFKFVPLRFVIGGLFGTPQSAMTRR